MIPDRFHGRMAHLAGASSRIVEPLDYRHLGKFCAVELAIEIPPLCFRPGMAQHHYGVPRGAPNHAILEVASWPGLRRSGWI